MSVSPLRTENFSTDFEREGRVQAAKNQDYQEIVQTILVGDVEKKIESYTVVGGLLFWKKRLTIPDQEDMKTSILKNEHDSVMDGHFGIDKIIALV